MIDLDKYLEGNKPYQKIIDEVTFDECICVAIGIPIGCNREEMIVRAIIQRLYEFEQLNADLEKWEAEHTDALYRAEMKGRADAIDECKRAIVNTESKVFNPCADKEWDVLTLLANRQFEILNILEQLKEKKK